MSHPDHTFTAAIFGDDRAKFGKPERDYLEKEICVSGKIENSNNKPQVVFTGPGQLKLSAK